MGISSRSDRRPRSAPRTRAGGVGRGKLLLGGGIAVVAAGALAATGLAGAGSALAAGKPGQVASPATPKIATKPPADGYQFVQLGSRKDRALNLILGINNNGRVAGYYGIGVPGSPSKGYTINPPYGQGDIQSENFPGSAQTVVIGLNDHNVQVGYFSTQNKAKGADNNFGWYFNGKFHKVVFPTGSNANPTHDQLAGVNNHDIAVGSYKNSAGRSRGFTFTIKTGKFSLVTKPGAPTGGAAPNLSANAINNTGDIAGEYTTNSGNIDGFIKLAGGSFHTIAVPGAVETVALGVNDDDAVVGGYIDVSGDVSTVHGFIWRIGGSLSTDVDDPNSDGSSVLDGINNGGDIVGYYENGSGGIGGFLAYPAF
jgi:hypothetical protein